MKKTKEPATVTRFQAARPKIQNLDWLSHLELGRFAKEKENQIFARELEVGEAIQGWEQAAVGLAWNLPSQRIRLRPTASFPSLGCLAAMGKLWLILCKIPGLDPRVKTTLTRPRGRGAKVISAGPHFTIWLVVGG